MSKNPFLSKLLLYVFGALLLIFTAYRTVDLVSKTLPAEAAILSVIAVIAFDGGVVAWLYNFSHGAKSQEQVYISGMMVVGDFAGVCILFVGHVMLNERFYVQSAEMITLVGTVVIWTVAIGVLSNVGALLAIHAFDPEEQLVRAKRDVDAEINRRAVEIVRSNSSKLAGEVAPGLANETLNKARVEKAPARLMLSPPEEKATAMPKSPEISADAPVKRKRGRPPKKRDEGTNQPPLP